MNNLLICANGPSASRVNLTLFSSWDIICVNRFMVPNPTYYIYSDAKIAEKYREDIKRYKGVVVTNKTLRPPVRLLERYNPLGGPGFSTNANAGFYINGSTTWAAMQLSMWKGYQKVVVIGIDQASENGKYYFNDEDPLIMKDRREVRFASEADSFSHLPGQFENNFLFISDLNPWTWYSKAKWKCTPAELSAVLVKFIA